MSQIDSSPTVVTEVLDQDRVHLIAHGLDRSPDAAYLLGPDGRMRYVNDAAVRALGYAREELLGMTIPDIDPDFPPERWSAFWEDLRVQKQIYISTRHRTKDGRVFPVEVVAYYFVFNGQEYDFAFARDVSERVREAQERALLEDRMLQAQKLESLGILAGGVAHDFNNLLVPILANAEIALRTLPPAASERVQCEAIRVAARRAAELCRQMLDYSGRGKLVLERVQVNELVCEMGRMLELAVGRGVAFAMDLAEPLPTVDADATQLRQVVMNLITNASDAIGQTRGTIAVTTGLTRCTRADLSEAHLGQGLPEGDYVCLQVKDTGTGMGTPELARLFDPFFTTKFTGRGLGLAVVLGIVRGHRGAIRVRSRPGVGTEMMVLLPVGALEAQARAASEAQGAPWRGHGTVLVVDDDAGVRTTLQTMVGLFGFEVVCAASAEQALEQQAVLAGRLVCVLLDLTMPGSDGESCFRALRERDRALPVVLCSGYHEQEATARFVGAGLGGFLQKPYGLADLEQALRRAVEGAVT